MAIYIIFSLLLAIFNCHETYGSSSFVTTEDGSHRLSPEAPPQRTGKTNATTLLLAVDDSHLLQKIRGFGAAWTDMTVNMFDALNETLQEEVMNKLFTKEGAHLSLIRHTIGQCDLSPEPYSFDNSPLNRPDPT